MSVTTEKQTRTYPVDVPVSITCDRCGVEIMRGTSSRAGGQIRAESFWYGSDRDGYENRWDICDVCVPDLEAWFGKAKL